MAPTIGLLGDVMLGRAVAGALGEVRPEDVWAPGVRELARECDAVIANLECCVSARGEPTERIPGKPFFFRAPPVAVESLHAIGVCAAGLANNHALDFETEALLDTLDLLDEAGIARAGAGHDAAEARRGTVIEAGGSRIGIVAVADHPAEFAAGDREPGIAHADLARGLPDWLVAELDRLRAESDHVIAFPHWGPNLTTEPAPWQRRAAGLLEDAGADLIAGHSAHVFHGVGWGDRGPIGFDLGDALDDYAIDAERRNDLGLMALWRPGGEEAALEMVGLHLDFCRTQLATGDDAEWIAARLERACAALGTAVERVGEQRFSVRPR